MSKRTAQSVSLSIGQAKLDQTKLLVEVARAYYEQNHTQDRIAQSLGISRSQVSRYLTKAREMNLVQVRIVTPGERAANLERALKQQFKGLEHAVVASAFNLQPEPLRKTLGHACAQYLERRLRPGMWVCIGSGRTLYEMTNWLHPRPVPDISIVQAMGSVGHKAMNIDFSELARAVGQKLGARVYYLTAPAILGSGKATQLIKTNPSIRETLQQARSASLFAVGIGSIESDLIFTQSGLIKREDLDRLSRAGAVGDVCARFFDRNGREVDSPFADRIVGIELNDLRQAKVSIGVAGGPDKVLPLLGALRGGLFKTVVTDEQTARSVLELNQGAPGP
jgi:DNA-binding transcriptional regulator LsrR (DeoR family)